MKVVWFCAICVTTTIIGRFGGGETPIEVVTPFETPPVDFLVGPVVLKTPSQPQSALAHPHPHGDQVCASGCALSRHPTARLTSQRFDELVGILIDDPDDVAAIDELLYFGPQTRARLSRADTENVARLSPTVTAMLQKELRFNQATVMIRLVSKSGEVLANLPEQTVRLDVRHEFDLQEHGIPELVASGTVKRVGRYQLWSRL
jgi:hypothetical protein